MAISFKAGQLVTANQLNLLAPVYAVKLANQGVTNSAVLVNDNDIVLTLIANQTVHLQAHVIVQTTSASPGLRLAWTTTGTVAGLVSGDERMTIGSADAGSPAWDNMSIQMRAFALNTNNLNLMTTLNSNYYIQENLLLTTGASGGTIQMQFAEFTATASTTVTMMAGTFAVARYVN